MTPRPPPIRSDNETTLEKVKRAIRRRGLRSLANDTKWKEFIDGLPATTGRVGVRPSLRCKDVHGQVYLSWDRDPYHLPWPIDIEWLDIARLHYDRRLPSTVTDFGPAIVELLERVGLEFEIGKKQIRVFGYAPKSMEHFDEESP
jgi:Family of unknown function (DUF6678)